MTGKARLAGRGFRTKDAVAVIALLAVGVALRWRPLAPSSLWLDDAWVALIHRAEGPADTLSMTVTAPGFSILLKGWLATVGFSELKAQLLPFLAGLAAAPAAYLIVVKRGLRRASALAGATLLLVAPTHLIYSTRVKHYTVEVLVALLVLALAWALIDRPSAKGRWWWFTAVAIAATMVSGTMAIVVPGAYLGTLIAVVRRSPNAKHNWGWSVAAYGAFGAVWWLAVLRPATTASLGEFWRFAFIPVDDPWTMLQVLWERLQGVADALAPGPAPLVVAIFGLTLILVAMRRPSLAALLGGPLLVAVVLAVLQLYPLGGGRTDLYLAAGLSLAIAVVVDPLAARLGKAGWALGIGAIVALGLAAVGSGLGPSGYPQEDIRPLVADLSERRQPDDRILVYEASRWAYALYAPTGMMPFEDPEEPIGFDIVIEDSAVTVLGFHRFDPERYAPEVAAGVGNADQVWLIVSHYREDAVAIDRELIANGYTLAERQDRPGAYLARWTR